MYCKVIDTKMMNAKKFFDAFKNKDVIVWVTAHGGMFAMKDVVYELDIAKQEIVLKGNPCGMFWTEFCSGFGIKIIDEKYKYWIDNIQDDGIVTVVTYMMQTKLDIPGVPITSDDYGLTEQ